MKALDGAMRADLRRMRADALGHRIMQVIRPFLDPENDRALRDAHYALHDLLMERGVEVLTDADREKAGLEPRTVDGWTPQEIAALEAVRLQLLLQPVKYLIPLKKVVGDAGIEPATLPV